MHDAQGPEGQWRGGVEFDRAAHVTEYVRDTGKRPRLMRVREAGAAGADATCQLALSLGTLTLVLDEVDLVCRRKQWYSDAAENIAHRGRHWNVDLFGAFRFTRNVNEDLPGLTDYWFVFKHKGSALYDLRLLQARFGSEVEAAARDMEPHECVVLAE